MTGVSLIPLRGFPLVSQGDDLARLIADSLTVTGLELRDDDVVVVTGKVVSKAEGRLVNLPDVEPSERARRLASLTEKDPRVVELVLQESAEVVRARPGVLLVRHKLGFVSAVAGIDRSNVEGDDELILLLPRDPDSSARDLMESLYRHTGAHVAVVITDSHGRPFRVGNVGVAIGVACMTALVELEGRPDLFGRPLTGASKFPVADLVASAAVLVAGEGAEGTPVVVARGLHVSAEAGSAQPLLRPRETDFFAIPDRDYD